MSLIGCSFGNKKNVGAVEKIRQSLRKSLLEDGYHESRPLYFVKDIGNLPFYRIVWLSFNVTHYTTYIEPCYGVGSHDADSLYRRITHRRMKRFCVINTGYLQPMNSSKGWFRLQDKDERQQNIVCDDIIEDLRYYGEAFFNRVSNIESLIGMYEKLENTEVTFVYTPLLYMINGEKEKGIDYMKLSLEEDWFKNSKEMQRFFRNYISYEE